MKLKHITQWRAALMLASAAASLTAPAETFTSISLPSLDTDIRSFNDGAAYSPLFPATSQTLGGVPFNFQADVIGNTAFIGGVGANSVTIPVNVFGVSSVYTLINTAFGSLGADVGSVTFHGSLGDTFTIQLIEGQNVRDHYFGSFVNTTSDPSTQQAVFGINSAGHSHLDMQTFTLPIGFANETLVNMVFTDNLLGSDGLPFIAGATVLSSSSVPENSSSALLLTMALIGLFFIPRAKSICS